MTVYPGRNLLHKYMAPPESCDRCVGRGWHYQEVGPDDFAEVYCVCPAGAERRRLETEPTPPNSAAEGSHVKEGNGR